MQPFSTESVSQVKSYTFKYESDNESIDLNTLLLSQIHFSAVLNEIKQEVARGANLSIKIKPLSKGSVPFEIVLNVSWLGNLLHLADMAIDHANTIITVLLGVLELRRQLKGKKPTRIALRNGKVVVTVGDVEVEVDPAVYQIHENNVVVDQALKKAFEAIESDDEVTGISLLDETKQPLIQIPREEFDDMTAPNQMFESVTRTEPVKGQNLTIFKVVFDTGYKWQFYLEGRKITASIKDNGFMARVHNGERFAKGDVLVVDMEVQKVYDKTLNLYLDKDFIIQHVHQHIPMVQQVQLSFNEGSK